jgi:hypothetical protein
VCFKEKSGKEAEEADGKSIGRVLKSDNSER